MKYQSDKIQNLTVAMIAAGKEMIGVVKDSQNPFFKSHYASLEAVLAVVKPPLLANDCWLSQGSGISEKGDPVLITTIIHASGEWKMWERKLIEPPNHDPQKGGTIESYAIRYELKSIFCLPQLDEDAESVMQPIRKALPGVNNEIFCDTHKTTKMLVSQFNEHKLYCPFCKSVKERA